MNSAPAKHNARIVARPTALTPSADSSASVEIASNPRKLRAANDSALKTRLGLSSAGRTKGAKDQCAPATPRSTATIAGITNAASKTSNATSTILLSLAVTSTPKKFIIVLNTIPTTIQAKRGTPGTTASNAIAT